MAKFRPGSQVKMQTIINIRRTPGVHGKPAGDIVAELPTDGVATIVSGPQIVDDMTWWQIRAEQNQKMVFGWAAQTLSSGEPLFLPTDGPTTDEMPTDAPGASFRVGDQIFLRTTMRLRRTPSLRQKEANDVIATLPMEVQATVTAGPRQIDGLVWWQVRTLLGNREIVGWLNETSFTGESLIEKVPQPAESHPSPSARFHAGQTIFTTTFVNLRKRPGYVGKTPDDILVEMPHGVQADVRDGPREADALVWWQVEYTQANGQRIQGWTAEAAGDGTALLSRVAPPAPEPVAPPTLVTYTVGDRIVTISGTVVNVRQSPGFLNKGADDIVLSIPVGQAMTVTGEHQQRDGLYWWPVSGTIGGRGFRGWIADVSPTGVRLIAPEIFKERIQVGLPYRGRFVISQLWGENPGFYRQFTYDGVSLKGHNGIDFALPIGTPLTAVAQGRVKTVGASPSGFGLWIMLSHDWGESVYAHMNRITVTEGQPVSSGHMLGESGNSGTSTGPHLHFAIRITPFFRGDGWGGYCDPLPFMDPNQLTLPSGDRDLAAAVAPNPSPTEEPGRRLP